MNYSRKLHWKERPGVCSNFIHSAPWVCNYFKAETQKATKQKLYFLSINVRIYNQSVVLHYDRPQCNSIFINTLLNHFKNWKWLYLPWKNGTKVKWDDARARCLWLKCYDHNKQNLYHFTLCAELGPKVHYYLNFSKYFSFKHQTWSTFLLDSHAVSVATVQLCCKQ